MYKYLYKYYLWLFYKLRPKDIPEWNSIFALCFFIELNFFLILFFLGKVVNKKVIVLAADFGIPCYVLFIITNYFIFIRNGRYRDLLDEVIKSDKKKKQTGVTIVILLAIEAFSVPWLLLVTDGFGYYR